MMRYSMRLLGILLISGISTAHAQEAGPAQALLSIMTQAEKVWDIIQENKPSADVETESASALPQIAGSNWEAVTGWQSERSVHLSLPLKNHYGMQVVDLEYDLRVIAGGSVNGRGLYIALAQIIPTKVDVSWSYSLNAKVHVATTENVGTADDPVAQIMLDVQYQVGNLLRNQTASDSFLILGDGLVQHLNDGKILLEGQSATVRP